MQDVAALLKRCESDLDSVKSEYENSLHAKSISADLKINIKNLSENLRSVLDYLAHEIRETYCPKASAKQRFYFPIAQDLSQFEGQMKKCYPGLKKGSPDLYSYLESIQPYHRKCAWLGQFNRLNNENKHDSLVEQTRTETERVTVRSAGGSRVSWTPQNVKFDAGVYIGGVPVNPATQTPVPHPSQTVELTIWVDFRFQGIKVSALGLLTAVVKGVFDVAQHVKGLL
jgi:hypothetical protein